MALAIWLLKLLVTPLLVGAMSLAVRVWGATLGGLIIGLPWMTGPVLFVIGLEQGTGWVGEASTGVLLGTVSIGVYALAYVMVGRRAGGWPASIVAAAAGYMAAGWILSGVSVGPVAAAGLASAMLVVCRWWIGLPRDARAPDVLPWWDIPARMLATAVLVVIIALSAERLGPAASGIVATFPVITTVLGTFTHAQWGLGAVTLLLRGLLLSLQSFVAFFLVTALTVEPLGLVASYGLALAAALAVTSANLMSHRRRFAQG